MRSVLLLAYRLYAEFMSRIDDFKHAGESLPPVPCQLCGKPGHKERYCPHAYDLGYFN